MPTTNTWTGATNTNWWTATNWDQGHSPIAGEAVVVPTTKTITWDYAGGATIPATGTLLSITCQGTGNITAVMNDGNRTLLCTTIQAGTKNTGAIKITQTGATSNTLTIGAAGNTTTITGGTGAAASGVNNTSSGTINIYGNVNGSTGDSSNGLQQSLAGGTINLFGNSTGGNGYYACGIFSNYAGIINVTGDITGGTGSGCFGLLSELSTSVVTLNSCNMINGSGCVAYGGKSPTWNNGTKANYAQWGGVNYAPQLAATEVKSGVTNGSVTGTLGVLGIFRGIIAQG